MLRVIAVVGATATGKSALALDLAGELEIAGAPRAEIVNADAMQLYRGMDIGTAKVTPVERRGIPHHQLDVLDPSEEASVAAYQRAARADLAAIHERGGIALVVGGSGLYVQGLLDQLEFPGTDPVIRAALTERAEREGGRILHDELAARDPVAAAKIEPANVRRVIRALEVIELTGRPFSASLPEGRHHFAGTLQLGLAADMAWLDERIARRALLMLDDGFVAEAAALGELGRTASRATGYAQALAHLRGELSEDELGDAIALATRQLARRQVKWFRRDPRTHWLDAAEPGAALREARRLTLGRLG
ncbi:MAG TPA: tRNA (adenosine(37)-N6)-dimethylallyltransferase MiaA [Actinomycetaceae bacterium]|nr:tRNA (adenosine(37)-N6)-dimethylallyltransferase MiaA [Actinomycetaceae bacterium]